MLVTFLALAGAILFPLLVGLPLRWLLKGGRPLEGSDWVDVPFLGLAGALLPLLELVYLDVPVRASAGWLGLAVLAAYLVWAWRGGLGTTLRNAPRGQLSLFLAV